MNKKTHKSNEQDTMSKDDEFRIRRLFRDFHYCCFVTTN
jgi:hypothetical protein